MTSHFQNICKQLWAIKTCKVSCKKKRRKIQIFVTWHWFRLRSPLGWLSYLIGCDFTTLFIPQIIREFLIFSCSKNCHSFVLVSSLVAKSIRVYWPYMCELIEKKNELDWAWEWIMIQLWASTVSKTIAGKATRVSGHVRRERKDQTDFKWMNLYAILSSLSDIWWNTVSLEKWRHLTFSHTSRMPEKRALQQLRNV